MSKLNQLKTNIQTLLPNKYYKDGKWLNKETNEFDLEFDCIENVFDYYSDLSFLDGKLAQDVISTGLMDFDSPSAHYVKNFITDGEITSKEKVLHKFTQLVNFTSLPAVLTIYFKNDSVTKCSLDANKYVDASLGKVCYTTTYKNGSYGEITYWSYDVTERPVQYQAMNCSLGEVTMSW